VKVNVFDPVFPAESVAKIWTVLEPVASVTMKDAKAAPLELVDVIPTVISAAPFRLYLNATTPVPGAEAGDGIAVAFTTIVLLPLVEKAVVAGGVRDTVGSRLTTLSTALVGAIPAAVVEAAMVTVPSDDEAAY